MNESPPFFSVVIPTYNRAALIERTLRSVLAQTWRSFEVIVVDDCSTDGTVEVLRPYVDRQEVRLLHHDRNLERAQARNTGMDAARGTYVTFLDSDDLMYPGNLQDAAGFAAARPDLRCFHNLYERVSADGTTRRRCRVPSLRDQLRAIAEGCFLGSIGVFIHREIYTRYRFDPDRSLSGSEDWEFWLRVLAEHRIGRLNRVNSGFVDHGARSVNVADLAELRTRKLKIVAKVSTDPSLSRVYGPYLRYMEASTYLFLASAANAAQRPRDVLPLLARTVRIDPVFLLSVRFWRALQLSVVRLARP